MTIVCPRCGAALPEPGEQAATAEPAGAPVGFAGEEVTTCGQCGHSMATPYLREAVSLASWHEWAGQRLTWLNHRLAAGDSPTSGSPALAPPSAPVPIWPPPARAVFPSAAPAPRRSASAGSLLLAVGAFLLVVAGIAFIAFTWDLLGPFGQIGVLLAIGVACLAATARLVTRLHGTATALGVVGTLLVVIGALGTRSLGPDVVGATAAMLLSVVVMVALCAAAIWLRPRTAAIGELAGVAGALVAVTVVASAPSDDAVPLAEPWSWWVALTCGAGAVGLILLADRAGLVAWPWVGAWFLVVSAGAIAGYVQALTDDLTPGEAEPVVAALTLVVAAVVTAAGLRRTAHPWPVIASALTVWTVALLLDWSIGVSSPSIRPSAALVLLAAGAVALVPSVLVIRPSWLRPALRTIGGAAVGAAVGLALAPWLDPLDEYLSAEAWAEQAWPAWRGIVAGLAFVALLVIAAVLVPRMTSSATPVSGEPSKDSSPWPGLALLVPSVAALATWLIAAVDDLSDATTIGVFGYQTVPTPDAFKYQITVALVVLALGVLAMALLRRLPSWSVWAVLVLGVPAVLIELSTLSLDASTKPEIYGLALGVPAVVTAVAWWWLRRPDQTPTWQTMAPPFVLAFAPSALALAGSAADRWWYSEDADTAYQVRLVSLLAIGVIAAVIGGRQRWGGLFFPGLALVLLVVGIELIEVGRFLPQWLSFAVAGAVLIAAGARWEWVRDRGRHGAAWVRRMR